MENGEVLSQISYASTQAELQFQCFIIELKICLKNKNLVRYILTKGGVISESFLFLLQSPKNVPKHYPEHYPPKEEDTQDIFL